jgi:hypothetical protein
MIHRNPGQKKRKRSKNLIRIVIRIKIRADRIRTPPKGRFFYPD